MAEKQKERKRVSYEFKEILVEGIIKSRPNRFIMMIEIDGTISKCHCPSTGRIGNIHFENIPCLASKSQRKNRKTAFTVEAISLDPLTTKNKTWIGINQTQANRYIEFFLETNQLSKMIKKESEVKREQRLGKSKIDLLIGNTYMEVKTPLLTLPSATHLKYNKNQKFDSFERLIKHFNELAGNLKKGSRAIIILCYLYDAESFKVPVQNKYNVIVVKAAKNAANMV